MDRLNLLKRITLIIFALFLLTQGIFASNEDMVYGIYDEVKDEFLVEKDIDKVVAIASLSKLMTCEIVFQKLKEGAIKLEDELTYTTDETSLLGSDVPLRVGHVINVEEALNLLLVRSANSAALLLAKHVSETEAQFVELMNKRANELGMNNTHFINSHGLPILQTDEQNTSTIRDLSILVKHLLKTYPNITDYTKKKNYDLKRYVIRVTNTNPLLFQDGYEMVDGLKTGTTTRAGKCLIATATQKGVDTDKQRRFYTFVLGAKSNGERLEKSKELVDKAINEYVYKKILDKNKIYTLKLDEILFDEDKIETLPSDDIIEVLRRDGSYKLKRTFKEDLEEDIKKGDILGEISLLEDGNVIKKVDLIATKDVDKSGFFKKLWKKIVRIVK